MLYYNMQLPAFKVFHGQIYLIVLPAFRCFDRQQTILNT